MNSKLQKKFETKGYIIVDVDKLLLKEIRSHIVKNILKKKKNFKKFDEDHLLNNFHKIIKISELNSIRFSVYKSMNSDNLFQIKYLKLVQKYLSEIIGNEIAMQKKINLSIQTPKDKDSLLDMHSDIYAGESPFEVVAWTPLVNVEKSKSMFFTKPSVSKSINNLIRNSDKKTIKELYESNKKKFFFLKINFGQVLIFSPLILHGNIVNKSKETRFSLNCRFKSLLSPYDVTVKSHRNIPNFYKPVSMKPMTKIGLNYIKKYSQD